MSSADARAIWRIVQPSSRAYSKSTGSIGRIDRVGDVGDAHRTPQADGRDDRQLRRRVGAVDVFGRIGFRIAGLLRLGQRVGERDRLRLHAAQDVVARAVQDAAHLDEPIARQPFLQRAQHGNAAGDRRLEPHFESRARARSSSSVPWCAISCLFAVTTDLPAASAPLHPVVAPGAARPRAR